MSYWFEWEGQSEKSIVEQDLAWGQLPIHKCAFPVEEAY